MKKLFFVIPLLLFVSFAVNAVEPLPEQWDQWEVQKGTYTAGEDKSVYRSEPSSLTIKQDTKSTNKMLSRSGICQRVSTAKYRGKRIEYSAYIKGSNLEQWAYIYASSGDIYPFKGIKGSMTEPVSQDWTKLSMVFDIPKDHDNKIVSLCFSLWEGGQMWIDDINWKIVGESVPVTYRAPLSEPIL